MWGHRNQYLQYSLNTFHHYINDIKKATIVRSVENWGQYGVNRSNDNTFVFNHILGYDIVLFDDKDKNGYGIV